MTGPVLAGRKVLVVEDDYYLASDAQKWLEGAGAQVVGPTGNSADAIRLAREERVDGAIVDINLGLGPSYTVARMLMDQRIPFIFITGYDKSAIPREFASVPRIEKPVDEKRALGSLMMAMGAASTLQD